MPLIFWTHVICNCNTSYMSHPCQDYFPLATSVINSLSAQKGRRMITSSLGVDWRWCWQVTSVATNLGMWNKTSMSKHVQCQAQWIYTWDFWEMRTSFWEPTLTHVELIQSNKKPNFSLPSSNQKLLWVRAFYGKQTQSHNVHHRPCCFSIYFLRFHK